MTTSLRNICYNGAKGFEIFIGDKDVQMMIYIFKSIQEKSKAFYCAYDIDSDVRLTKQFWADSIGRRNFELYGDAISFEATFDTNRHSTAIYSNCIKSFIKRYNLIFAPFTSVDKHDRCVTFASCLLSHESVDGYSGAFGHLVKATGRNPVLIIIDHCPTMKVSIRDVFSDVNGLVRSKHRLCMWHIMEKFSVKEELVAFYLEMQIKSMSEEVDGVTHFEIRDVRVKDKLFKVSISMNHTVCSCKKFVMYGIVCRHAFYGLKQIGVTKFPRSLVLNRWMQTFDSGTSSNLDVAGVEMDRLEHVHGTIKKLNTELDDYDGSIISFMKKDHIVVMVGQQPKEEVNILPPECLQKQRKLL
ncbi:uncharacterized protein LOC141666377 [Apium graveolens]|uniref:uncharacterized protein LOC141666377 n=1 Tax=Apium graveolens TaxID=4045 RepID=UPI003D7C0E06